MTTVFDLRENDPLDLVKKNTRLVKHLKENGIDGFHINKILADVDDAFEIPIKITSTDITKRRAAETGKRNIGSLVNLGILEDGEIKFLKKIYNRLDKLSTLWAKDKKGKPIIKLDFLSLDGKKAKSLTQMIGWRVVELYNYISSFNTQRKTNQRNFNQADIFKLIGELFAVVCEIKYEQKQIHDFYFNNR